MQAQEQPWLQMGCYQALTADIHEERQSSSASLGPGPSGANRCGCGPTASGAETELSHVVMVETWASGDSPLFSFQ